ncbi:MAG: glycosyltransferase family 1 protein, partial [Burkholderiaceae bacterium]
GEVPAYLPAGDSHAWVQEILAYSNQNRTQRQAQLQRMQSWQAPSWAGHFERVDTLLASLAPLQ